MSSCWVASDLPAVELHQMTIFSDILPCQVGPVEIAVFRFDGQMKWKSRLQVVVFMLVSSFIRYCKTTNT
jgi:hypothetical protein